MTLFLLGGLLSAMLVYAFYWRAQRDAARLEEEKQALLEERQIVIAKDPKSRAGLQRSRWGHDRGPDSHPPSP